MKLSSFAALFLLLVAAEGRGSGPRDTLRRKFASNMVKEGGTRKHRALGTGGEIGDTTYDHCGKGKGGKGKGGSSRRGRRLTGCDCSKGNSCYEDADPFDDPFLDVPSDDDTPAPASTTPPTPAPTPAPGDELRGDSGSNNSMDVDVSYDPYTPSNDAPEP